MFFCENFTSCWLHDNNEEKKRGIRRYEDPFFSFQSFKELIQKPVGREIALKGWQKRFRTVIGGQERHSALRVIVLIAKL